MNERMMAIRDPDGSRSGLVVVVAEVGGSCRLRALVQVESALYDGRCRAEEARVDRG